MKRNKGVSMITLIITIIVIIILAAIAFVGMDDATGSAQYAKFSSEFGDYATNFTAGAVTKVQESLGLAGKVANKSQIIYCAARGVNLSEFDKVLNGVVTPGGYTSERFQSDIKDATGAKYVLADENTPVYEIKDDVMNEYKGKSFYGNANGEETHWVTATGKVFTLPGYPRIVDGEERMYISADLYYVPSESASTEEGSESGYGVLLASSLVPLERKAVGNDVTTGNQTYADAADHVGTSGSTGTVEGELLASKVQVGDYVNYPVPYTNVQGDDGKTCTYTGWRVLSVELDGTVKLVSAGVPIAYYHPYYNGSAYSSVKTLTDELLSVSIGGCEAHGFEYEFLLQLSELIYGDDWESFSGTFYEIFILGNPYTEDVRALTCEDLDYSTFDKINYGYSIPPDTLYNIGTTYWLATVFNPYGEDYDNSLWCFRTNDYGYGNLYFYSGSDRNKTYGVRLVVTLKPTVVTTGQDASGAWNIDI